MIGLGESVDEKYFRHFKNKHFQYMMALTDEKKGEQILNEVPESDQITEENVLVRILSDRVGMPPDQVKARLLKLVEQSKLATDKGIYSGKVYYRKVN